MALSQMAGVESLQPGSCVFQISFMPGRKCIGSAPPGAMLSPAGPRHCGQVSVMGTTAGNEEIRTRRTVGVASIESLSKEPDQFVASPWRADHCTFYHL